MAASFEPVAYDRQVDGRVDGQVDGQVGRVGRVGVGRCIWRGHNAHPSGLPISRKCWKVQFGPQRLNRPDRYHMAVPYAQMRVHRAVIAGNLLCTGLSTESTMSNDECAGGGGSHPTKDNSSTHSIVAVYAAVSFHVAWIFPWVMGSRHTPSSKQHDRTAACGKIRSNTKLTHKAKVVNEHTARRPTPFMRT